jgi:hypothetical protein
MSELIDKPINTSIPIITNNNILMDDTNDTDIRSTDINNINDNLNKIKSDTPIIFRNRIYRIIKRFNHLWYIHDYFISEDYYNTTFSDEVCHNTLFYLYIYEKKLTSNKDIFNGLLYEHFISEIEIIDKKDINVKAIECIQAIQKSKIVKEIPINLIKEAEKQHIIILETKINKFIKGLMKCIIDTLETSTELIETLCTRFTISEYDLSKENDILYEYPNLDGVIRNTFDEYLYYIFEKIYPLPTTSEYITSHQWMVTKLYELLCEYYPMLDINLMSNKYYINLKYNDILH